MTGVEISGIDKVQKMIKPLTDKETYIKTIEETANKSKEYSKRYAPKDSGDMETGIIVLPAGEFSYQVICVVPYAYYNEWGHSPTIPPFAANSVANPTPFTSTSGKSCFRPFMRPGAHKAIQELGKIFGSKLRYSSWK